MKRLMLVSLAVACLGATLGQGYAQEDTTPPVLLDFTIAPMVFDAGSGDISLRWCARAQDDLSGVHRIAVDTFGITPGPGTAKLFSRSNRQVGGYLEVDVCFDVVVNQFSIYDTYVVRVDVSDQIENERSYGHPIIGGVDLCLVGTCELLNRPADTLPDSDMDGIPDDADNCPNDSNTDQEDFDLDLIGDACDPFPDDRDNEKAQCFVDLDECLTMPPFQDADADGEHDGTDRCPGTGPGTAVDDSGCSLDQYCAAIDANAENGKKTCNNSDWKNDEPLGRPKDCKVKREAAGSSTYLCVPR